ncbi:MAG: hypothetical protein ABIA97_04320 [Candidatus Omnitrophota bacterium]
MEISKLKEVFHTFFNKINNIFTAVGANKMVLEEDLDKLSPEELKQRIADLGDALKIIEKNVMILYDSLRQIYEVLKKEAASQVADTSSSELKK